MFIGNYTRRGRRIIFLVLTLLIAAGNAGCGPRTLAQTLIGHWRGAMKSGNVTLPYDVVFHEDGSDVVTITLPQSPLVSKGSYHVHEGMLVQRTTDRTVVVLGEWKTIPLRNPIETTFHCQLSGDSLTLTHQNSLEEIVLTRAKK